MKRDIYKVLAESYQQVVTQEDLNDMGAEPAQIQQQNAIKKDFVKDVNGHIVLANDTHLPDNKGILPKGTPSWVYYIALKATPEEIKAIMNQRKSVRGFKGSMEETKPAGKPTPSPVPPQPTHKVPFKKNPFINKLKDKKGSFGDLGKRLG